MSVDELIELLRDSGYGCYVNSTFIGCLMYADDLLLLSPTVGGMQALLPTCDDCRCFNNIVFNTKKMGQTETDGQTDGSQQCLTGQMNRQTHNNSIYRASIASSSKNVSTQNTQIR